ncbi:MAG TPA: SLC13 family permease [Azoarcus sp.]|nr:SLC13 family permease [Azoarcus sp.]
MMSVDQGIIFIILMIAIGMFLWGRWRHDMIAIGALLACVLFGLVDPTAAFDGLGHPAVVTVACVLVLSRTLQNSGAVDVLTHKILPKNAGPTVSIVALTFLAAVLSGFMNNVGALALLMPVALQLANRLELPPGKLLMPLAFASILGGMVTLIGTPPNMIVSGFRAQNENLSGFGMFDFAWVGLPVMFVGVAFIALVGWRLVPRREPVGAGAFDTGAYLTEVRVPEDAKADGMRLSEIEVELDAADAQIVGLIRNEVRLTAPSGERIVRSGDVLVIEADAEALAKMLSGLDLKLEEVERAEEEELEAREEREANPSSKQDEQGAKDEEKQEQEPPEQQDDLALMELVVRPESALSGRSANDIQLRSTHGLNLLAVSREGARSRARLRTLKIRPGDVLLMQGFSGALSNFASEYGCVPLAERGLRIPDRRRAIAATAIMFASLLVAALGWLPASVAFAGGVLASMALRTIQPAQVYRAVDWPVIVLLGALIPVAGALESTGAADLIARLLLEYVVQGHAVAALVVLLIVTMILSDIMNNAATAAVMCPIAIGTAAALGINPDALLMAVAIGASCAFLTPIGHQNNMLILGPGGFRFGDYWKLGLLLEVLVVVVSVPLLLIFWPLNG